MKLKARVSFLGLMNIFAIFIIFTVIKYNFGDTWSYQNLQIALFSVLIAVNVLNYIIIDAYVMKNVEKLKKKVERMKSKNSKEVVDFSKLDEKGILEFDEINEILKEISAEEENKANLLIKKSENMKIIINNLEGILGENKKIAIDLKKELVAIKNETKAQIENIENTNESIQEMVNGIKNINDTVGYLSKNAMIAVDNAEKGNMNLEKVVLNMNEIQQNAEDSVDTIDDLGQKIKEIQIIVDAINSISSRTNLLALNATIEAEKAINDGNQGDGFIVVAEEIKKLAFKSSGSTVEIEKIAKLIIDNKDKAIEQIDKNRKEVRKGILVVNEASKSFNSILRSTNEIGKQLYEVTSSSEQLARGTEEITYKISKNTTLSKEFEKKVELIERSLELNIMSIEKISELLYEMEGIQSDKNV